MAEINDAYRVARQHLIRMFEQTGGKPFEVTHVPVEALQGQVAGATDPMQKSFAGLMLSYATAGPIDMDARLRAFAMKLRSVEEYVQAMMPRQWPERPADSRTPECGRSSVAGDQAGSEVDPNP